MYEISIEDCDLEKIMDSGQVFRIRKMEDGSFLAMAGKRAIRIRQEGTRLLFSCTQDEFLGFWQDYFDLPTDYAAIRHSIDPADAYLTAAASFGRGIRILRQDLWETILAFLISQNNNISRIQNSLEALCTRYGARIEPEWSSSAIHCSEKLYAFPTPESLCSGGLEGLHGLGLGYRDKYILKMAERCCGPTGKEWLKKLSACGYEEAMNLLLQEYGIGRKVADCICLFSLHHVDAFPIDTHVRQILDMHYPEGFPFSRYQGYAGILQQYLFYYRRSTHGNT